MSTSRKSKVSPGAGLPATHTELTQTSRRTPCAVMASTMFPMPSENIETGLRVVRATECRYHRVVPAHRAHYRIGIQRVRPHDPHLIGDGELTWAANRGGYLVPLVDCLPDYPQTGTAVRAEHHEIHLILHPTDIENYSAA